MIRFVQRQKMRIDWPLTIVMKCYVCRGKERKNKRQRTRNILFVVNPVLYVGITISNLENFLPNWMNNFLMKVEESCTLYILNGMLYTSSYILCLQFGESISGASFGKFPSKTNHHNYPWKWNNKLLESDIIWCKDSKVPDKLYKVFLLHASYFAPWHI